MRCTLVSNYRRNQYMGSYSRSGHGNHFNPNHGSNHYQRRGGIMGGLFNLLGSRSNSHGYGYPQANPQQYSRPSEYDANIGAIACPRCRSAIPSGSKFCLECGEKVNLALHCSNCGEQLPGNAKFCLKCGTRTGG